MHLPFMGGSTKNVLGLDRWYTITNLGEMNEWDWIKGDSSLGAYCEELAKVMGSDERGIQKMKYFTKITKWEKGINDNMKYIIKMQKK
jgi:hypothetical protein